MTEYEFYNVNEAVSKLQHHYVGMLDFEMQDVIRKEKAAGITGERRSEQAAAIINAVVKSFDDIINEIADTVDTGDTGRLAGLTQAAGFLYTNIKVALLTERGE